MLVRKVFPRLNAWGGPRMIRFLYVTNRVSCAMLGEWDVRPGGSRHGRTPRAPTLSAPREPEGQVGWPLCRSHRAGVSVVMVLASTLLQVL